MRKTIEVSISNVSLQCNVYSLDEKKGLILIDQKMEFENFNDKSALCGFAMDKMWFSFPSKLIINNNKQYVEIPKYIIPKERREYPRTTFVAREAVSVSILESFGQGIGVTGKAVSISEGGICASIIRVVNLSDEKELRASPALFTPNQPVMLVRVKGIPGVKEFDTEGKVIRVKTAGGSMIAVKFKSMPGAAKKEIKHFISSRIREFKLFKRSRKKRREIEDKQNSMSKSEETKDESNVVPTPKPIIVKPDLKQPKPFTVLSMGEELLPNISFLSKLSNCQWIKCKNPLELSMNLRKSSPKYLVLPYLIGNNNILDYLKKLYSLNLLDKIDIVILISQKINVEDVSKCKLLGIKHLIGIPLLDPNILTNIIK